VLGAVIAAKYCVFTLIGLAPVLAIVAVLGVRDIYVAPADEFAFAYMCIVVNQAAYFVTAWLSLFCAKWRCPHESMVR
jgi:hypothetical protein